MKRKLIPFFLSAAVLLTSCSSSGNKTTDGSTTASDVFQTVSGSNQAESVSSVEETEQADGLTKTLQIYDGIDIIKEYDITPESPLWFIGEAYNCCGNDRRRTGDQRFLCRWNGLGA